MSDAHLSKEFVFSLSSEFYCVKARKLRGADARFVE